MIELTPRERRELRAKAHHLHPLVSVGQHGLTPGVLHEIDLALKAHGLVKVRVFIEDRSERDAMLQRIASELDGAPVQHLGKLLILWRPPEEEPAKKPVKRVVKKAVNKKPALKRAASQRARREPRDARPPGRRARGQAPVAPAEEPPFLRRGSGSGGAASRAPRGKSAPNPRRRRGAV